MKTVALYLLMVGLPLTGVLGVLRLGRGLEAPPHLAGAWWARAVSSHGGAPPCVALATATPVLDVAQSGVHLELSWRDPARTPMVARLDGDRVAGRAARLPLVGAARELCPDSPLVLGARVVPEGEGALLVGTLSAPECAACSAVTFRAARAVGP